MALIDDEMTWSFANGSMSLLDFIDNDDNKENDSTFIFNEPLLQLPAEGIKDDIFDLLSLEEIQSLTDNKPDLPSYDQIIADCTKSIKQEDFDKLNITPPQTKQIKQEVTDCGQLTALRAVTPASHYTNKLRYGLEKNHSLDTIFQKEDSMSISLDDITSIINNNQDLADSLSPISPNSISSEGSSETFISSGLSDFESNSPKRAPLVEGSTGPTKKPRRRKATDSTNSPHLWQFILELLGNKDHNDVIAWTGLEHHFKVHNSRELARLWGVRKNKPRMNFDKLSRAMRYYYDKNIIRHIPGQRLVYKFCRNADDAVYTRLLTDASRTIPPLPLVTCTARTPTKLPTKPSSYKPNKSVKDAFTEQQQLKAHQYYLHQQQLQRQQRECFNAQQDQLRQQQQLAAQQQQLQMQQMQQLPCSPQQMPCSPQQMPCSPQPHLSPIHSMSGGATSIHSMANGSHTMVNGSHSMSPQMQYQPLQHYTPPLHDDFYNIQPTIGNISPTHGMNGMVSPGQMPTIQGSPNHLLQSPINAPCHMMQGSQLTYAPVTSTQSQLTYAPVTSAYDSFYKPY